MNDFKHALYSCEYIRWCEYRTKWFLVFCWGLSLWLFIRTIYDHSMDNLPHKHYND